VGEAVGDGIGFLCATAKVRDRIWRILTKNGRRAEALFGTVYHL
jgi:hypothetical protein